MFAIIRFFQMMQELEELQKRYDQKIDNIEQKEAFEQFNVAIETYQILNQMVQLVQKMDAFYHTNHETFKRYLTQEQYLQISAEVMKMKDAIERALKEWETL